MEGENPKGAGSGGGKGGKNCSRDRLVLESRELTDAQNPARHPDSHGFPGQKRNTPPMPELVLLRHQAGLQQALGCQCRAEWVVELWLGRESDRLSATTSAQMRADSKAGDPGIWREEGEEMIGLEIKPTFQH